MAASKLRTHNEWFQSCASTGTCDCGTTKKQRVAAGQDPQTWIWGEYISGKWRRVGLVCQACVGSHLHPRILQHAEPCGGVFAFQARSGHGPLPAWLTPPTACAA